jgi:hypothetical protein
VRRQLSKKPWFEEEVALNEGFEVRIEKIGEFDGSWQFGG